MPIIAAIVVCSVIPVLGTGRIHMVNADKTSFGGTATAIGKLGDGRTVFATAKHVIEKASAAESRTVIVGHSSAPFEVLGSEDGQVDVAVIAARVSAPSVRLGDPVAGRASSLGFDYGGQLREVRTEIVREWSNGSVTTAASSSNGRSGGGLFQRGRLVGVCCGFDDQTRHGIYFRSGFARRLLERATR